MSDDLSDYDIISNPGQRSPESSLDFGISAHSVSEPAPSEAARDKFDTVRLSADEIQTRVRSQGVLPSTRTKRIYVDGIFHPFTAG